MIRTIRTYVLGALACTLVALAACKDDTPPKSVEDIDVASPTYSIINLLTATGNTVDVIGRAPHPYFDTRNVLIRVNGGVDLELYEYSSKEDLEQAAATIAHDGSTIAGKPIAWQSPPHFFKTDKILMLYNGSDPGNVAQLASAFGPPFAGK